MNCIYCENGKTKVVETAATKTKVIRVRKCLECGGRFSTEELGYKGRPELYKELRGLRTFAERYYEGGLE